MVLVCHKSMQEIKILDYIEESEISLSIDWPCLSDSREPNLLLILCSEYWYTPPNSENKLWWKISTWEV